MFNREVDYPTAVASYDDTGIDAAIDWCLEHMQDDDTLTVWTSLKSNLENCTKLEQLVNGYNKVEHVTARQGGFIRNPGPVLMAWPDMDDIAKVASNRHIRAMCVITANENQIRPWVTAVGPSILADGSAWESSTSALDPILVEALKGLTLTINHNNTIAAGFEKDQVVGVLLALHKAGIPMNGPAMQGWAIAHGWSRENPKRLAKYVDDINAGKRPRSRSAIRPDYIATLRRKVEEGNNQ